MTDNLLIYRQCGAETRDDRLRMLANENGLPLCLVQQAADPFGEAEEFGALVAYCEGGPVRWRARLPKARTVPRRLLG